MNIDLSFLPIVDVHCHPWRTPDVLAKDPSAFEDRLTLLGTCQLVGPTDPELVREIALMSGRTPLVLAMRRHLSGFLDCDPTRERVAQAREQRYAADPAGYQRELFDSVNLRSIFCDAGYPLPVVDTLALSEEIGRPVHRVGRLEVWIKELQATCSTYQDMEDAFLARVESEASYGAVAFKSVIAYRTGLDIEDVSKSDASSAYRRWREDGFAETRAHAKPVRDRLMHQAAVLCGRLGTPIHIHCGGGDPDVQLTYARPSNLFAYVAKHTKTPVVLIHGGWPWMEEAAYIASIFTHVYMDVSVMLPWSSLGIDQKLEIVIGTTPGGKVMYGSDEGSEPEVLWLSALYGRAALGRVLAKAVEHDWLSSSEANSTAADLLGGNALRLHNLETVA